MNHSLYLILTIAGLTLSSLLTRTLFLLFGEKVHLGTRWKCALRYAPVAALAAIALPDFLNVHGQMMLNWHNPRLVAAIIAIAFFMWRPNMLFTIIVGMLVFTGWRLYF